MAIAKLKDLKHIPGDDGLPYFGELFPYLKHGRGFFEQKRKKFGDVFRSTTPFSTSVTLLGPTANKFILVEESKFATNKEAWGVALDRLFPNGLMLMDGDQHTYHRNIMNEAFKKGPMQGYLDIMPDIISKSINTIKGKDEILAFPFFKELTLSLATKVFFGLDAGEQIKEINRAITDIVNASLTLQINLPWTKFGKGLKARKYLEKYFQSIISTRRADPGPDLFSKLCTATSEEGHQFTDREIIDHIIFVLMAAHDTTAITLTMMTYFLCKYPEWQSELRNEAHRLHALKHPSLQDMRAMTNTGFVMKETLRIHPPLIQVGRKLEKEMTVEGHRIPKDTLVSIVMQMTHTDERVWSNPDKFDPLRFNKERSEHQKCPFAYAPFGAGRHHCIGYAFAEIQVKLVMATLLSHFEISTDKNYECPIADLPLKQPKDQLPVRLKVLS